MSGWIWNGLDRIRVDVTDRNKRKTKAMMFSYLLFNVQDTLLKGKEHFSRLYKLEIRYLDVKKPHERV